MNGRWSGAVISDDPKAPRDFMENSANVDGVVDADNTQNGMPWELNVPPQATGWSNGATSPEEAINDEGIAIGEGAASGIVRIWSSRSSGTASGEDNPPRSSNSQARISRVWSTRGSSAAQGGEALVDSDTRVAGLVAALARLSLAPAKEGEGLAELLGNLHKEVHQSISISPPQLVAALRSLAALGCHHKPTLEAISSHIVRTVGSFALLDLAECAWSLAELHLANDVAAEAIFVEALRRNGDFDITALSRLAWPLSAPGVDIGLMLQTALASVPEIFGDWAAPTWPSPPRRATDDTLLRKVLQGLAAQVRQLSPRALMGVLWALALLGVRDGKLVADLVVEASQCVGSVSEADLATFAWALGTLGYGSATAAEVIAHEVIERSWKFSPTNLTKVVFGYAVLGLRHVPMMETIAEEVMWKVDCFKPSDLAQLSWAFATLCFPKHEMMIAIAKEVVVQIDRFGTEHMASTAWAFARLRLRHGRLMAAIAREAASKIRDFDEEDLGRVAWAFATLDLAPPELTRLLLDEATRRRGGLAISRSQTPRHCDYGDGGASGRSGGHRGGDFNSDPTKGGGSSRQGRTTPGGGDGGSGESRPLPSCAIPASSSTKGGGYFLQPRTNAAPVASAALLGRRVLSRAVVANGAHHTAGSQTSTTARWTCPKCGFLNSPLLPYCEVCEAPCNGPTKVEEEEEKQGEEEDEEEDEDFPRVEDAVATSGGRERRRCGGGGAVEGQAMTASKKLQPEFKRLPPLGRVPQRKRKKRAQQAIKKDCDVRAADSSECDEKGKDVDALAGAASARRTEPARDSNDFDEDFDVNCGGGGSYDLLDEALGQDDDDAPSYDILLESLRAQLRTHGVQYADRLTDQQILAKTEGAGASREDQETVMRLLEERRLAEKVAQGKTRSRSAQKKKERSEKKLDREYVKVQIKNAYNAEMNQGVRYYNSVAIKVHRGEKSVDEKTIAAVSAHASGEKAAEKETKEDRVMARRCA